MKLLFTLNMVFKNTVETVWKNHHFSGQHKFWAVFTGRDRVFGQLMTCTQGLLIAFPFSVIMVQMYDCLDEKISALKISGDCEL